MSYFNLILREIEQYRELKTRLRSEAKTPSERRERVDVEALREEIRNQHRKKLGSLIDTRN